MIRTPRQLTRPPRAAAPALTGRSTRLIALRLASTWLQLLPCLMLCLLTLPTDLGATRTYRYTAADGTVTFTDHKLPSGANPADLPSRSSYQGKFGRPVATKSCQGMTHARLEERATRLATTMQKAAEQYAIDAALIKAIARVESCFDPYAVSRAGARGVMQLMPATASMLGVTSAFNSEQNIDAGTRYFSELLQRYEFNTRLALAAYNAGPGAVKKYQGIPPYPETRQYVKRVLQQYRQYSRSAAQ